MSAGDVLASAKMQGKIQAMMLSASYSQTFIWIYTREWHMVTLKTDMWMAGRESGAWRDHHCSRCLKWDAVLPPGLGACSCFRHCATAQTWSQHTQLLAQPSGKVSGFTNWVASFSHIPMQSHKKSFRCDVVTLWTSWHRTTDPSPLNRRRWAKTTSLKSLTAFPGCRTAWALCGSGEW